jgi:hypothetical protein
VWQEKGMSFGLALPLQVLPEARLKFWFKEESQEIVVLYSML